MDRKKIYKGLKGFLLQTAAWGILILFAPLMVYVMTGNSEDAKIILAILASVLLPCMAVYLINYYLFVPRLFFRDKKLWYFVANIFTILIANWHLYLKILGHTGKMPEGSWMGLTVGSIIDLVMYIGSVGIALAIRNYFRTRSIREQLNEEMRRHSEAELQWLKKQLNPHFLFNSLNNISSLVCFDADRAQECIGRLSDLLRLSLIHI